MPITRIRGKNAECIIRIHDAIDALIANKFERE